MLRCFVILLVMAYPAFGETPNNLVFEVGVPIHTKLGRTISDALRLLLEKEGYHLTVKDFPAKRGLQELKAGRIEGSVGRMGDLNMLLETQDLVLVDQPVAIFHLARWCRPDLKVGPSLIRMGARQGSVGMLLLQPHLNHERAVMVGLRDLKIGFAMLRSGRLDCVLSPDLLLEADGVSINELNDLDRFDLMAIPVRPWLHKSIAFLKKPLEEGLKSYAFSEEYRRTSLNPQSACENRLNVLCPDGLVFFKRVEF